MAAHARVPWPMEPERKRLELLAAREEFDRARCNMKMTERMVACVEDGVEKAKLRLAELEELRRKEADWATEASAKLVNLSTRRP